MGREREREREEERTEIRAANYLSPAVARDREERDFIEVLCFQYIYFSPSLCLPDMTSRTCRERESTRIKKRAAPAGVNSF